MLGNEARRDSQWVVTAVVILPAVVLLAILTFRSGGYAVESSEPKVYEVKSTWWGFKKEFTEIRWMRAPVEYEFEGWCAKDKDGAWYPYIIDDDLGERDVDYP